MGAVGHGRFEVGVEWAEAVEVDKKHLEGVHDWKRRMERGQEVDSDLHGFGKEQTPSDLSPCLCLWVQTGSGDEVGEEVGFPQALNTLSPDLKSPHLG